MTLDHGPGCTVQREGSRERVRRLHRLCAPVVVVTPTDYQNRSSEKITMHGRIWATGFGLGILATLVMTALMLGGVATSVRRGRRTLSGARGKPSLPVFGRGADWMRSSVPSGEGDTCPDQFDNPKRPGTGEPAIRRRHEAGDCEQQGEDRAPVLEPVEQHHQGHRDQTKEIQCRHTRFVRPPFAVVVSRQPGSEHGRDGSISPL